MRIPESKIEEIRSVASIVDVISGYVQLRKRGRNYIGLCPFHSEKTPSFTVSEEKQIFHCFGCHTGGNVYKFLMDYEKISFVEAVQELAKQLGIEIEYDSAPGDERQSELEFYYDINTEAAKYFYNNLHNSDEGEIARKYLLQRKIKSQTMKTFGLGYALSGWENFLNYSKEKKLDLNRVTELGILIKSDDGRYHDRFAGRLIFPVFSPNGRVVAFAGRVLDEREKAAKYLNSPESSIYTKGRILYGLSFAKDEIRKLDKAILVEGYMDLISLYQSGIKNVVAVSGTALTEEQVQLLSRYTKNVVLLFDADAAGIKASMRSIELLLKRDVEVKIAALPADEDPDSFVNKYGKDDFEELIKKAENFLEYQSAYFEKQGMFKDPAKMTEAIRELVKSLVLINDEIKRNVLVKVLAKKFDLRTNLIEREILNLQSKVESRVNEIKSKKLITQNELLELQYTTNLLSEINYLHTTEKDLIRLIYENEPRLVSFIFDKISPEEFEHPKFKKFAEIAHDYFESHGKIDVETIIDIVEKPDDKSELIQIIIDKNTISNRWELVNPGKPREESLINLTLDTVSKFQQHGLEEKEKEIINKIELADEDEQLDLMKKQKEINIKKSKIKEVLENSLRKYTPF